VEVRTGGILPVEKPEGPTSHDIVARARRSLDAKVGHTGTLDPFASGLLLLCVGAATRLSEYLTSLEKSYVAEALLGERTDTLDPEGEVVERSEAWKELDRARIEVALAGLRGRIEQVPPRFSAKKVGGEAMHRRARRGEEVALNPVPVEIHALEIVAVDLPRLTFRVRCSSGTYVRALARDLGQRLEVPARLSKLRRTRVGAFSVEGALPPGALDDAEAVEEAWIEPARALGHLPSVEVSSLEVERLAHGRSLEAGERQLPRGDEPVVFVHDGALVAVGETAEGRLRPRKVFLRA